MTQQINLYDPRLRPSRELATARNLGVAVAVLLLTMTAAATWLRVGADRRQAELANIQTEVRSEQTRLAALEKQLAEQKVSAALLGEIAAARDAVEVRSEALKVLDAGQLGNATGFSAMMSGFARQTVGDLWLTGFTATRGGEDIEIRGRLLDPAHLPAYVQRLSREPVFQGRRFATLQMKHGEPEAAAGQPAQGAQTAPPPALPRYVEFVLRSENIVPATVMGAGKGAGQ